jgi:hypothetical protein
VERVVGKVTGHMLGPGLLVKYLRQLAGLSALLAILTVSLGWVLCALLWPRKMSDNSLSEIQEENLHAT